MVRKWEAMYYLRKFGGFSLVALLAVIPSLAFANTIVTSQTYVDMQDNLKINKDQGSENAGKALVVNASGVVEPGTIDALPAGTAANQVLQYTNNAWTPTNIDTTPTAGHNQPVTSGGIATALGGKVDVAQGSGNAGQGLIVNSSGNLALANILQAINSTDSITASDGYVVKSVTTTDNKTVTVVRDTVKIPVASGAPSSNTPTAFAEVWVQ